MRRCRRCEQRITDDGSAHRMAWCDSIRRLVKVGMARPEDYHQKCFLDALLDGGSPTWAATGQTEDLIWRSTTSLFQ